MFSLHSSGNYKIQCEREIAIKTTNQAKYSQLSLNGHLYTTDTSVKRTPSVDPCLSLLPLFDSLAIRRTSL